MDHDILDIDLVEEHEHEFQPSIWNWIAVILLWLGLILCIVFGLHSLDVYAAMISLSIISYVFWKNYQIGVKWIFAIIIAGIIGLLTFFPIFYSIGFEYNNSEISFDILLILIGGLHYFTNREMLSYTSGSQQENENEPLHEQPENRAAINRFKRRFKTKQLDELEFILYNDKMVNEARKAAKELISEKTNDG
ncbi:MAG: hypothetical protein AAGA77_02595 [Bacteroidota bacterium]